MINYCKLKKKKKKKKYLNKTIENKILKDFFNLDTKRIINTSELIIFENYPIYLIIKTIDGGLNRKKGRKKKGCIEKGKHTKFTPDNLRDKVKNRLINYIIKTINDELKNNKIEGINGRLIQLKKEKKINYVTLLNKSFRDILSKKITEKAIKYNGNHNQILIDKIYEINRNGKKEEKEKTQNIIKILNMTIQEFFYYLNQIMDGELIISDNETNYILIVINKFASQLDEFNDGDINYNACIKNKCKNFLDIKKKLKSDKKKMV